MHTVPRGKLDKMNVGNPNLAPCFPHGGWDQDQFLVPYFLWQLGRTLLMAQRTTAHHFNLGCQWSLVQWHAMSKISWCVKIVKVSGRLDRRRDSCRSTGSCTPGFCSFAKVLIVVSGFGCPGLYAVLWDSHVNLQK